MVNVVYATLTDAEHERIAQALLRPELWKTESRRIPLPPAILAAQSGWTARASGTPHAPLITVIRNMPTVGEDACTNLARWMGFQTQGPGFLRLSSNRTRESGFTYEPPLPWHTDEKPAGSPPEYVVLACQRGSSDVVTSYVPVRNILQRLDAKTIEQLKKPDFSDGSTAANNAARPWERVIQWGSLLAETPQTGEQMLRYRPTLATRSEAAQGALEALGHAIESAPGRIQLSLTDGDWVIFDNQAGVHNRNGFEIRSDSKGEEQRIVFLDRLQWIEPERSSGMSR